MADIIINVIEWALTHWFELTVVYLLLSIGQLLRALIHPSRYIAAAVSEDYRDFLREKKFERAVRGK